MAVSKPLPGTPIDPTNPWARGLVNAMLGNQSGQRVINHAPNFNGIDGAGTALQLVGSPGGGAIKGNGTSAYANYGNQTRMRGTGAFTVAFRALFKTVTPGNFPTIYSSGYDGSNASLQVGFNFASAGNGKLWVVGKAVGLIGAFTTQDFSSYLNQWFDFIVDYDGLGTNGYTITVNGVPDFTTSGSGARAANGRNVYLGGLDLNGTPSRFFDGSIDYLYHWEGRTFSAAEKKALRANPWQLWPDEPQLVFAPVTGTTITAAWTEADDTVAVTESSSNAANLAWTEGNDTAAISETSSASASISWAEADDIAAAAITAASQSSLAWLEESDTIAINVLSGDATAVSDWIITARRRGRR